MTVHNNLFLFFFLCYFYKIEGLISYSIPKGVQRGIEIDLSDQTYDGRDEGDRLVGGLGQLVDGQRGTDNFRADIHGYGKGNKKLYNFLDIFILCFSFILFKYLWETSL